MKKYTLYCGLNDKDTRRQEISTLEAAKMVRNACLSYADGATIFEADGIYKHDDGELVAEKTLRVELMMVEQSVVSHHGSAEAALDGKRLPYAGRL